MSSSNLLGGYGKGVAARFDREARLCTRILSAANRICVPQRSTLSKAPDIEATCHADYQSVSYVNFSFDINLLLASEDCLHTLFVLMYLNEPDMQSEVQLRELQEIAHRACLMNRER